MAPLRLLWHATAPWVASGYGVLSWNIVKRLKEHPGVVEDVSWLVIGGAPTHGCFDWEGIHMLPPITAGGLGEEAIGRWSEKCRADLVVSVIDHWVWKTKVWEKLPWWPIAFPDNDPLSERLLNNLKMARRVIAPTRWGESALRHAGITNTVYIPLGVDIDVFQPDEEARRETRRFMIDTARRQGAVGLKDDCFIFGMVARNSSYAPFRKGHDLVMESLSQLLKENRNILVYMHSALDTSHNGVNLCEMAQTYGVPHNVLFPDPFDLHTGLEDGGYPSTRMRGIYNAMDCLVNPSMWEGFGMPSVEAAACGVPAIVTDAGCQPETAPVGWRVPVYRRYYANLTKAFIVEPDVNGLTLAMRTALKEARDPEKKQKAVKFAQAYSWDKIVEEKWLPLLEDAIASRNQKRAGLSLIRPLAASLSR